MIAVADFMTKDLVTVRESDDVALAESLLRLGGIRHLPVVLGVGEPGDHHDDRHKSSAERGRFSSNTARAAADTAQVDPTTKIIAAV